MCDTFAGRIGELNYKTLRYPGHRDLMKFLLTDLNLNQKQDLLTQVFEQKVPLAFSVAALELFVRGHLRAGFVKRESIALEEFFGTEWGGRVYRDAYNGGAAHLDRAPENGSLVPFTMVRG